LIVRHAAQDRHDRPPSVDGNYCGAVPGRRLLGRMARVTVLLVAFLLVIGLCDRMRQQPAAESMAAPPQESSALGLGASAIASLPVYKYEKKSGGGSD